MTTYTPQDVYIYACDGDSDNLVRALKVRENRINWYRNNFTGGCNALHDAFRYEQCDCVGILIDSGINVNSKSTYNSAPLDCAARSGNLESVELILNRGADINSSDHKNQTALTCAAFYGHIECVALLLNRGATIDDEPHHELYFEDEDMIDC